MKNLLPFVLAVMTFSWASPKPMEPLDHYNVVLVHGATPSGSGFESMCDGDIDEAYTVLQNNMRNPDSNDWNLGGAAGMLGGYNEGGETKLTYWLDSAVFEDYQYRDGAIYMDSTNLLSSPYIYIQRSFANPAASPAHNAREVGDRTWKGEDGCSSRRALLEEAQEVRGGGQDSLQRKRTDSLASYRTIPSRNILIAHSMGGVASREYVQSNDFL